MGFLIPLIVGGLAATTLIGEVDTAAPSLPPPADDEQWDLGETIEKGMTTIEKGMTTIQLVAVAVIVANTVGVLK